MTAATFRRLRSSQSRDACRTRSARSGATNSITIASANGNNDTTEKKTQPTMYCVVLQSLDDDRRLPGDHRTAEDLSDDRREELEPLICR